MKQICEDVKAHAREIVEDWEHLAREGPWGQFPKDYRIDHLPAVVAGLAEASLCEPVDTRSHQAHLWAAAEHGSQRRVQGIVEDLILREYYLLRQAMWSYIRRTVPADAHDPILRIDVAISLATMASLRGYYRREFEARGEWPQAIEEVISNSPFFDRGSGAGETSESGVEGV